MEAVYIFDQTERPLLNFSGLPAPSIEEVISLVLKKPASSFVELTPSQLAFKRRYGSLDFVVPCSTFVQPMAVEAFVNRLISCLEAYFDSKLTAQLIEANASTIMQLLYEMLDAGQPRITEPDILKGLVPTKGLLDSLWSSKQAVPAWNLRWRRQGITHAKNQIFIDLVESLQVVISNNTKNKRNQTKSLTGSAYYSTTTTYSSRPQVCRVRGQVKINCLLTGEPRVSLQLGSPTNSRVQFTSIAFHPSVDSSQWESRGSISFTPPDGHSVIAEYTLDLTDTGLVNAELLKNVGADRTEFEVRVSTSIDTAVEHIQDLQVTVHFPQSTRNVKELRLTAGDLATSSPQRTCWSFGAKTPVGWNATFRGQATNEDEPVQPLYATVSYKAIGRIPSKLAISDLSIQNQVFQERPYRGVRYQTLVDNFSIR